MVIPRAALLLAAAAALAAAAPAAHGDVVSLAVDGGPHGPGDVISVSGEVSGAGEHRLVTIQVEGPGNVIAHREMVEAGADGRFSASFAAGEPKYRWGDGAYQVRADHAGGRAVEVFVYFAAPPVPDAELQAAPAEPPPPPEDAGGRGGSGPGPLDWLPPEGTWGLPALAVLALAALAIPAAALAVRSRRRGARAQGRAAAEQAAAEGQAARAGAVPRPAARAGAVPGRAAQETERTVPRQPAQEAPQKRAVPRQPAQAAVPGRPAGKAPAQSRAVTQPAQARAVPRQAQPAAQALAVPRQAQARAVPRQQERIPSPAAARPPDVSIPDREALLREAIPDGESRVVIDSNVYIDITAEEDSESKWDGKIDARYHPRLAVPREALGEVARVLHYRAGHDASLFPAAPGMLAEAPPDGEFLRRLEDEHGKAAGDPDSDAAGRWLHSKRKFLAGEGYPGGDGLEGEPRKEALELLYKEAGRDRMITAAAAAVAARDDGAYLVTSDGDMTMFGVEIEWISGGRLRVRRPEAAGARGRLDTGEAEDGQAAAAPQGSDEALREHDRYVLGRKAAAILLGKSVAYPLAVKPSEGDRIDAERAAALDAVWKYISAGGGRGRAGMTGIVRGVVAWGERKAGAGGPAGGPKKLAEAACLATEAHNKKKYREIVWEVFRDKAGMPTERWAGMRRDYLKEHGVALDAGTGRLVMEGGGEADEGKVREILMGGIKRNDVGMLAEAMHAAEKREVVLITDDSDIRAFGIPLLRRILEMRATGEAISPVWVIGLRDAAAAVRDPE